MIGMPHARHHRRRRNHRSRAGRPAHPRRSRCHGDRGTPPRSRDHGKQPGLAQRQRPLVDPTTPGSAAPCLIATTTPAPEIIRGVVHSPGLVTRPSPGQGLVLEADDLDEAANADDSPTPSGPYAKELLARAQALIPGLSAQVEDIRRCIRPLPADGYPLIGTQRPGLYTAVTHSGMTLGPHLAELITREINGTTEPALNRYRPDRPIK